MAAQVDSLRVLYSGSLQVPVCVGSVAVPLELAAESGSRGTAGAQQSGATAFDGAGTSVRSSVANRFTHKRFCYVRDGGSVCQDSFYRWLLYERRAKSTNAEEGSSQQGKRAPPPGRSGAVGQKRRRHCDGAGHRRELDNEQVDSAPLRSPSLFYSIVSHVEFLLPKSFPCPRYVVYEPPFLIEDNTWAPHLLEIRVHFLPELAVLPVTLVHQVFLHPGSPGVPRLLSSTFTKPLSSTNPFSLVEVTEQADDEEWDDENTVSHWGSDLAETLLQLAVCERKDSLRILHPSVAVLLFTRRVLAAANTPTIHQLEEHYWALFYGTNGTLSEAPANPIHYSKDGGFSFTELEQMLCKHRRHAPWDLPYEFAVYHNSISRGRRAVRTLRKVLASLIEEQQALQITAEESMKRIVEHAESLHRQLDALHETCLNLRK